MAGIRPQELYIYTVLAHLLERATVSECALEVYCNVYNLLHVQFLIISQNVVLGLDAHAPKNVLIQ